MDNYINSFDQLFVVAGCQRSGTTLTGQVLGAHSQCFLMDEPDGFYDWFNAWEARAPIHHELLTQSIQNAAVKYSDHRRDFKIPGDLKGYKLVLKAPNLTFKYVQLSQIMPRPKIIFCVRDARSVVASMLKFTKMNGRQTEFFTHNLEINSAYKIEIERLLTTNEPAHIKSAIIWSIKTKMFEYFRQYEFNPLIVQYEKLVLSSHQICQEIAKYCGIPFEENLLNHHQILLGKGPGKTMRDRKLDDTSLLKWQNDLTEQQVLDVKEITGLVMNDLGYRV